MSYRLTSHTFTLVNLCCLGTRVHTILAGYIRVGSMTQLISLALAGADVFLPFLLADPGIGQQSFEHSTCVYSHTEVQCRSVGKQAKSRAGSI